MKEKNQSLVDSDVLEFENSARDAQWAAKREAYRLQSRPDISKLPDAIVDGEFLVGVGKRVVIERCCSLLSSKTWLDTKTYEVQNYDGVTGELVMYDDETRRRVVTNVKTALELGYVLKQSKSRVGKVHRIKLTKAERAEKKKLDIEARKERASKKRELRKRVGKGLRRLYAGQGVLVACHKKRLYVSGPGTRFSIDSLAKVTRETDNTIRVTHPTEGWHESWTTQ